MTDQPTTAVIGAGISGLTAGKALSDRGLPYTCFEASDDVGGNWYFGNPNGRSSAYQSLHIDTSRDSVSFRDMPMGPEYSDYPYHAEIKEYLGRYADAFGLRDRIRFKTAVERAERKPDGGWRITLDDGSTEEFDFLVVGNGHHWDPRFPDFPGRFDGEVIHSHHYIGPTDPLDLRGKRVLVVGIGNSAVDITSELSRKGVAEAVFISTRSGAWVMPKYLFGKPVGDIVKTIPAPAAAACSAGSRSRSPTSPRAGWRTSASPPPTTTSSRRTRRSPASCCCASATATPSRSRTSPSCWATASASTTAARSRSTRSSTRRATRSTSRSSTRTSSRRPGNRLPLYKRVFRPGIDDLALIGFAQVIPTLFPFVELQSKLVAAYVDGDYALPSEAEMEATISADDARYVEPLRGPPPPHDAGRLVPLRARRPDQGAARRPRARPPGHGPRARRPDRARGACNCLSGGT